MQAAALNNETQTYDVRLCYPFIEGVTDILTNQCHVNAKVGSVGFKNPALELTDLAIVGNLSNAESVATIAICFPARSILGTVGKMLGESYLEINAEVEDAAKELANMFFNQAKLHLSKKGIKAVRSIPQIIIGNSTKLRYLARGKTVVLPVTTDVGPVTIEITSQPITISDMI